MKIFSFFAANIKYGGGIVSHLPLCLLLYPQVSCNIDGGRKQPPPRQLYIKPVKQNLVNIFKASSLSQNRSSYVLSFWPCSLTPCIIDYVKTAEKYSKTPNHHQCTSAHSPFCQGESAKFLHGFKSVLRFDVLLQGIFINVHIAIMWKIISITSHSLLSSTAIVHSLLQYNNSLSFLALKLTKL